MSAALSHWRQSAAKSRLVAVSLSRKRLVVEHQTERRAELLHRRAVVKLFYAYSVQFEQATSVLALCNNGF